MSSFPRWVWRQFSSLDLLSSSSFAYTSCFFHCCSQYCLTACGMCSRVKSLHVSSPMLRLILYSSCLQCWRQNYLGLVGALSRMYVTSLSKMGVELITFTALWNLTPFRILPPSWQLAMDSVWHCTFCSCIVLTYTICSSSNRTSTPGWELWSWELRLPGSVTLSWAMVLPWDRVNQSGDGIDPGIPGSSMSRWGINSCSKNFSFFK